MMTDDLRSGDVIVWHGSRWRVVSSDKAGVSLVDLGSGRRAMSPLGQYLTATRAT